jgi:hypothetical protein
MPAMGVTPPHVGFLIGAELQEMLFSICDGDNHPTARLRRHGNDARDLPLIERKRWLARSRPSRRDEEKAAAQSWSATAILVAGLL